ncbi:MAG: hypothetical protein KDB53_00950 [Planctomycetes bacterium]|nr:hypothetical protein [Planctomycetota bacterium]
MKSSASNPWRRPLRWRLPTAALLAGFLSVSCMNNKKDGDYEIPPTEATLYIANSGVVNPGDIAVIDESFATSKTFRGLNDQGLAMDVAFNMFQAGRGPAVGGGTGTKGEGTPPGSVQVIGNLRASQNLATFNPSFDRLLGGAGTTLTGLVDPKGITIAHRGGYLIVADFGAGQLKVFGTAAGGDAPPLAITPIGGNPWDVVYDNSFDELYVAVTNGTIEAFDGYIAGGFGTGGASRVIIPSDGQSQISTNLHGIDLDFPFGLFVTDVGVVAATQSPSFDRDGAIYVFDSPDQEDGLTVPSRTVAGQNTRLGNPVDCKVVGDDLYVAEKAQNRILRFKELIFGSNVTSDPDVLGFTTPESIEVEPADTLSPDVSDVEDPTTFISSVASTNNPAAVAASDGVGGGFGELARLDDNLGNVLGVIDVGRSLENVSFDATGDAYVSFDDGNDANGGIYVVNRANRTRGPLSDSRDRRISGPSTTLVSPKGVEITRELGLILVADNNATTPGIVAFGTQAGGDVPPAFRVELGAVGRPWDLDYDPDNDRLYVALTNGQVAVFDQLSANRGAAGPARMITPADVQGPISVNLHGIVHCAGRDLLILSDVGSAADATDGRIFAVPGASTADGNVVASLVIGGPATNLGNPVDLAFDGADLYVAEKANNLVLRFDAILATAGGDFAPSVSLARNAPESVCLVPSYLSRIP